MDLLGKYTTTLVVYLNKNSNIHCFTLFLYRTSMMEGSGSLEQQLEAIKVIY